MLKDSAYRIRGGRIGVLLIHGLGGTPAEMRLVANGLARAGHTVSCPQLAGHGGTEADLKAATWQDWYAGVKAALEDISGQCDAVIVGGLSTGAVLSLLLAANHPEKVQALALFSPTLWLSGRQIPWYVPLFRIVSNKFLANLFNFPLPLHVGIKDRRIRDFLLATLASDSGSRLAAGTPGGAVLERRRLAAVVTRLVAGIAQPALIIHAREDGYAGLDNAMYLQSKLAGPVDLAVLDDSSHMVTIDRQRDVVLERTAAFVARIARGLEQRLARTLPPETREQAALAPLEYSAA